MNAFTGSTTPGPLFYRGLGYGLAGAAAVWLALALLVSYLA